jgi:hypothetical protein
MTPYVRSSECIRVWQRWMSHYDVMTIVSLGLWRQVVKMRYTFGDQKAGRAIDKARWFIKI